MSLIPSSVVSVVSRTWRRVAIPAEYRVVWRVRDLRLLAMSRFWSNLMFYSTVIVAFERSRGLTFTQMFLLESILSAAAWLLDIPTGVWAELIGYRRLLLLARVFELTSLIVTIFAYGFWPFAFGAVLYGAHLACASGSEDALVYASLPVTSTLPVVDGALALNGDIAVGASTLDGASALVGAAGDAAPSDNAQLGAAAFALLGAANSAGFCVGLALGSFIGARSPTLAVVATVIPMTLALVVTLRLSASPSATPHHTALANDSLPTAPIADELAATQAHGVAPHVALVAPADAPTRLTVRELLVMSRRLLLAQPALVALSLGQSASFALVNAIFWYNQPYFATTGIAVRWYGPLTALAVGCALVAPLAMPGAIRRIGRRWALAGALLAPGLAYLGLGLLTGVPLRQHASLGWLSPTLTVGLIVFVVGGSAWRDPLIGDELARRSPVRGRAAALSALSFVGTLAGIALNPLIGRVGDAGLRAVGLALGGGLIALAISLPWLLQRAPTTPTAAPPLTPPVMNASRPT